MLSKLGSLHQDVSSAILALRELERYGNDFTAAKKAEMESAINALIGMAQKKMDTLPDLRSSSTWEAEAE